MERGERNQRGWQRSVTLAVSGRSAVYQQPSVAGREGTLVDSSLTWRSQRTEAADPLNSGIH